jgi:hypothetical protein
MRRTRRRSMRASWSALAIAALAFWSQVARADVAIVSATSSQLRKAPSAFAPVVTTLARGERLDVSKAPEYGWRWATQGGLEGYVPDADITVTGPSGEAVPGPSPLPESRAAPTERRSYALQMMGAYAPSLVLTAAGYASNTAALAGVAWLGLLLVPPIVHVAHANTGPALVSLGVRVLIVGSAVELVDNCLNLFGGPEPDDLRCQVSGVALVGALIAMPILDFALAYEIVERPASNVGIVVAPVPGSRSGVVSVAGRF